MFNVLEYLCSISPLTIFQIFIYNFASAIPQSVTQGIEIARVATRSEVYCLVRKAKAT